MKFLGILTCLVLTLQMSYASPADTPMVPISQSERARLVGLQLSLVDDHMIKNLYFRKDKNVTADIGIKGGPVCGPIFHWSLSKDNVLTVTSVGEGIVQFKWTAIGFVQDGILVQSAGKMEHYAILKKLVKPD